MDLIILRRNHKYVALQIKINKHYILVIESFKYYQGSKGKPI